MKEELITTYKEYEQVVENGENKKVKGLGRLMAYQGLDFLKEQLNKCYSEEFEDSLVAIIGYINDLENICNLEKSDK